MDHEESAGLGPFTLPVWLVRSPGPIGTFTPCSRGGSGAANTRRGPGCLQKQNWPVNSAAGPALPRGRSGHSTATGWPGRSSEKGTYRPAPMLIHASHDAPSRLHSHASVPPSAFPACLPYTRVNRDHQQDVVFADVRTCRAAGSGWRLDRVYFLTFLNPSGDNRIRPYRQAGQSLQP